MKKNAMQAGQSSLLPDRVHINTPAASRDMISRIIVEPESGITDSDYYRPLQEKIDVCVKAMNHLGGGDAG